MVAENIHPIGWFKKLTNAYRGFRDFGTKLGDVTRENTILSDECIALRRRVADLEARLATRATVVRRAPFLYQEGGAEEPICSKCWTNNEKVVAMNRYHKPSDGYLTFQCNVCSACEKDYSKKVNEPQRPIPFSSR